MSNRSRKTREKPLTVYLRLYPETDLSLIAFIREQARTQDRTVLWQVRKMLKDSVEAK